MTGGGDEFIKLDQFLKVQQMVRSGGEAKHMIQLGAVRVNGEVEIHRGRKLRHGDLVTVNGVQIPVEFDTDAG